MLTQSLQEIAAALQVLMWETLTDPAFYIQVGLFALVAALAWLLARQLRRVQRAMTRGHWPAALGPFYFPLLGLTLGRLILSAFEIRRYTLPIFNNLYGLFWVLLGYRLAVAALERLRPTHAEMIRRRILLPFALLFVTLRLMGQLGVFFGILNRPLFYIAQGTPQQIAISLPLLVLGPLSVLAIYAAAQGIRALLIDDVLPGVGFPASRAYAVGTLISYAVVVVGTLLALAALGVSPNSLTVFGSALAVGVGFGLQNTVNNLVSGFLIMFDPLINVGDTVEIANERGVIRYIGVRNSVIETGDGTRVVMPNADLANSPVLNFSTSNRPSKAVLLVPVGIEANPHKVHEALRALLTAHREIRTTPAPSVALLSFAAGVMTFELTFWVPTTADKGAITHAINLAIWDELHRLGYELAPRAQKDG